MSAAHGSTEDTGLERRSRWSAMWRVACEYALLFAAAVVAKHILAATVTGAYPNPLWFPVIVLSLQQGLAGGVAAAVIAAAVQFADGLPPQLMGEDMYSHIGRIAAEPVGWTCAALLIGHIRSRQLANLAALRAELAERNRHAAAVADLCVDLRARTELLERQIAANAHTSNIDIADSVSTLHAADFEDFGERLTRFIMLMTGSAEFSVHLLRENALAVAFRPSGDHRSGGDVTCDHPVFTAIVEERRILSAARAADAACLRGLGILAAPLRGPHDRTIGMIVIGGVSIDDQPADIERRLALVAAELSRLATRIAVIDRWHAAAAPSRANGHAAPAQAEPRGEMPGDGGPGDSGPASTAGSDTVAVDARPRPELTLQ